MFAGIPGQLLGPIMLGYVVTVLHRNARMVILATPVLIIAAGAMFEVRHFIQ